MSTNRAVVTTALRMLGVIDAHETATAEDAELALGELNDMMADLEADGIDLGYVIQDDLSDEFPCPEEAQLKPMLAVRLLTFYPSQTVSESLMMRAEHARQVLYREAVLANREETSVTHAPLGERGAGTYNILTDE